jgi:hypothetical protein
MGRTADINSILRANFLELRVMAKFVECIYYEVG